MKALVVGATGMLGTEVVRKLRAEGCEVVSPTPEDLDITDPVSVASIAAHRGIDWCVNCSGYTAVDRAEAEPEVAMAVNGLGPGYLARAAASIGARFIHISTDFVFDGTKSSAYVEEDKPNPLSVYGRSKLEGEIAVREAHPNALIFRTSWLFGVNGANFPATMIRAWLAGKTLRVVSDQQGNPTYARDLAQTIWDSMQANLFPGTYHATGPETMTWHELAIRSLKAYKEVHALPHEIEVAPILTEEWPVPATRPKFSALSNDRLHQAGITSMRPIDDALREFAAELQVQTS